MTTDSITIHASMSAGCEQILTPEALAFITELQRRFDGRRRELLQRRVDRQTAIDAGQMPDFLPETASIRESEWTVAPIPADLTDRRVEITGPVDRKMVINALNSGANVFMADFEDSNSPTWSNNIQGQINLRDAIAGTISYTGPEGKQYALAAKMAVLLVRPRGWHLVEKHVTVDGQPVSGSLFDFGFYFFHNAKAALARGTGPYFYLPKMQSHLEARLWNDVFVFAQDYVGVPQGSIRATVLIETILAAFEMDEILWELRNHSAGLNCGRWDYIFSFIKTFRNHPRFVMPNRAQVTMTCPFLHSYVQLLIRTCHRRGIFAMGGMAAQIPIDDVSVTAADLLAVPTGDITEEGLKVNIDVGIQYLESWLMGNGCVPIYNLMEDAATAEISRTQVWQWLRHGAKLQDGRAVTPDLIRETIATQLGHIRSIVGGQRYDSGQFPLAAKLFEEMMLSDRCADFLTLAAYEHI